MTMPKGIFIGLGGAGVTTVARLKALLFQRAYGSSKADLDADCTFIFYDTDSRAKDGACKDEELRKMMGTNPVIDEANEYIDAGYTVPYSMYQLAKNAPLTDEISQRMLEWAIDPDVPGHFQLPNKPLGVCAGAHRMAGRTGFLFKRYVLERKIMAGLSKFQEQLFAEDGNLAVEHPLIWVFSSSNGSTSSSVLLDVLYLVDRLYKARVVDCNPYLHLVLYMPKAFMDVNEMSVNYYALNAYSTLWELNAFRADAVIDNDGRKFGTFAVQPDRREWANLIPWKVCRYVMAVDTESDDGRRVRIDQMYANTAETCYFMHTGASGQTMVSGLDNDFETGGPFYGTYRTSQTDRFKWANFVLGSGYKAINKADDFLKDYVRRRFRYDVLGYGLLGPELRQVWPNQEDLKCAVKSFVEEYILKHLIDIDRPGRSDRLSLYRQYEKIFAEALFIPYPINREDAEQFAFECRKTIAECERTFDLSKKSYIEMIQNSVLEGMEKNIVEHGLLYTYQLLDLVDDGYCELVVSDQLEKMRRHLHLSELETDINHIIHTKTNIIQNIFGNAEGVLKRDLEYRLGQYRDACLLSFVTEGILSIIRDITQEKVGLLEYLRKGDRNHLGLRGLMNQVQNEYGHSVMACRELATTFRKTADDVCNDYFPRVHEFVNQDETWKSGHLFESLYDSIVPLDSTISDAGNDEAGFARRPIRSEMARILFDIKEQMKTNGRECRFANAVLCQPGEAPSELKNYLLCVDGFIEDVIHGCAYPINAWLDKPLESVFDECFVKDGILDVAAKQEYCNRFSYSVPLFYPVAHRAMAQVETRRLFVGNSPEFAVQLGYTPQNCDEQFVLDKSCDHRLVVLKYEVGHNFYDYEYFDMLNRIYEDHREQIEREAIGCHIHKEFVYRDIAKAYEHCKAKRFKDFISLCWYDSFFEYLNSLEDKSCIKAFFGEQIVPSGPFGEQIDLPPMPMPPGSFSDDTDSLNRFRPSLPFVNESFHYGYIPIVSMVGLGGLRLIAERIEVVEGRIVVRRSGQREMNVKPQSLFSVFSDMIHFDDLDWSLDYLCKISEQFQNMSSDIKAEIQKEFHQASLLQKEDNGSFTGEVWDRFREKLKPMLARLQKTKADEMVLYIIESVVVGMSENNIFSEK